MKTELIEVECLDEHKTFVPANAIWPVGCEAISEYDGEQCTCDAAPKEWWDRNQ